MITEIFTLLVGIYIGYIIGISRAKNDTPYKYTNTDLVNEYEKGYNYGCENA